MVSSRSLNDLWQETLRANRNRRAVIECATQGSFTFDELNSLADVWVERIAAEKLSGGDRVMVKLPNSADFVAVFLALLRLRLVMTPVDHKLGATETANAMQHVGARLLVTKNGLQRNKLSGTQSTKPGSIPEGIALLKLTSGSTGAPKGIALTDSQLIADSDNICSTMDIRLDDLNFGVIALSHSYGFDNLVVPLITQGTPMALLDEFLPRAILDGIAATRATVFPAVPFLLEMLNQLPSPLPAVSSLRTVITAGAPLTAEVYTRFHERFGLKTHQFYGSSECGGITYDREPSDQFVNGCVGTPVDNVLVDLVEDGRVRVRGANVATGYFPSLPHGEEQSLADNSYLTGDIGQFDEQGRLHLLGRVASFINVAGRKVNPFEVEECIQRLPGVASVAVLGVADASRHESIAAFVVSREGQTVEVDQFLQHCRNHLASWKVPRLVKVVEALPRTPSGKLDRMRLKKMLEDGE